MHIWLHNEKTMHKQQHELLLWLRKAHHSLNACRGHAWNRMKTCMDYGIASSVAREAQLAILASSVPYSPAASRTQPFIDSVSELATLAANICESGESGESEDFTSFFTVVRAVSTEIFSSSSSSLTVAFLFGVSDLFSLFTFGVF